MPGFSGIHGKTGEKEKKVTFKAELLLKDWSQNEASDHFQLRRPAADISPQAAHHRIHSCRFYDVGRVCVCVWLTVKKEKTWEADKDYLCLCERAAEMNQARPGAAWVRGQTWASADKLVNEQTWRPPRGHRHIPPSLLHLFCHPLPSRRHQLYSWTLTSDLIKTLH